MKLAVHAEYTVALLKRLGIKAGGTDLFALAAVRAQPSRDPSEYGKISHDAKERTKGAEVLAPVPLLIPFEKEDADEKDEREKGEGIEGLPERQDVMLQEREEDVEVFSFIAQDAV